MHENRNLALDLIRGLCAIAVACYHYTLWNYDLAIASAGAFGVYTFFALSGLAIMMVDGGQFSVSITADAARNFFAKRIARILPLLAAISVANFIFNVLHGAPVDDHWPRAVVTLTGAFMLGAPGFLSNATGAWSLGIEGMFYLLFPVIALFVAGTPTRTLLVWFAVLVFLQQATISIFMPMPLVEWWPLYATPLTFAPFFLAGILSHRDASPSTLWRLAGSLLLLAGVLGYSLVWDTDIYHNRLVHTAMTLASCAVVWMAYRATLPGLLAGVASFLGKISYALYLTHWFVNKLLERAVVKYGLPSELKPWLFAILALVLAYLCYVAFEAPAQSYLRKKLMNKIGGRLRPCENLGGSVSAKQVGRHAD